AEHCHTDAEHLPGAEVAVCQFSIANIFGKRLHKNDKNFSIPLGRISMNAHSKSKAILALVLAISIAATGCSAQWINIALQDLPVLTQMALNITDTGGNADGWKTDKQCGNGRSSKHFRSGQPRFELAADHLRRIQSQPERH